jgi:CO/xanthine dehydrogenase Mo-binding subunit
VTDWSPSLERNPRLDSWLRIHAEGRVVLFTGKVELGQGIRAALAWIAAEELDVSPDRITVRMADTARGPNELFTAGSQSMEDSGRAVRLAAATARSLLLERAAERLGTSADRLSVDDGTVSADGHRHTTYWELADAALFDCEVSRSVQPKAPDTYRLVGRPAPRPDLVELVTGRSRFVADLELPGMLYGRVVRPPSRTAALRSLDSEALQGLPGVIEWVRDGRFLGVIAEREEQALRAQQALQDACEWDAPQVLPTQEEIFEGLVAGPHESLPVIEGVARDGPVPPLEDSPATATTLSARYRRPYHMHASIAPSAALARLEDEELTIWTHSQGVHLLRPALAQALKMDPEQLRLIHVPGPGCYGHNGADDAALDAALLARAVPGRPVLLQWTREQEHGWEPYGPAMVIDLRASLSGEGEVIDWSHDVYSNTHMGRAIPLGEHSNLAGAWLLESPMPPPRQRAARGPHSGIHRNADPLYAFPKRRVVKHLALEAPLRTSSTRSLGAFANVFAVESFMDELAHAAGRDPVEFRLHHLRDDRAIEVIEAAAGRAGWGERDPGPGRGRGIGFARYKNAKAYAAVIVELSVDRESGAIRLERVVIAADAGQIVDPPGLANQLAGGVIQSASWTLIEQVRFDSRQITSTDWESYPILGFAEIPEIETVLLDRPGQPYLGSGEATQGPTPAAITNAVFDATGLRLRTLPFTPERVLAALGS